MPFGFLKKNKHKAPPAVLTLYDHDDAVVYRGRLDGLSIAGALVVELSEFFFNDPDPCYIHRGAVLSRIFSEIEMTLPIGEMIELSKLPENMRRYFCEYKAKFALMTRNDFE